MGSVPDYFFYTAMEDFQKIARKNYLKKLNLHVNVICMKRKHNLR